MRKEKNGFTRSKNPESKRFKRDMARHLDGRSLKCVTERIDGVEEIVGRGGAIAVKDDELIVLGGQNIVLRTKIQSMKAWELMSLEGVVITAPDEEHGGEERTVIAYYSYWRTLDN